MLALKGLPYGYFTPTYKLLSEVFDEVRQTLLPLVTVGNKSDKVIKLRTGGSIDFWTLDDKNAGRSRKYAEVAIDEAGQVKGLGEIWEKSILPTLTDFNGGTACFAGTPHGMNFFHAVYQMGLDPGKPRWSSWQMPTVTNPLWTPELIEQIRTDGNLPDRAFRQEFLAEFLEDAGGVFQGVRECIGSHPQGGAVSFFGLDLARTQDYTVLSGLSDTGIQRHMSRWNGVQWEATVERVGRVVEAHPGAVLVVDSSGVGDPVFELIRKRLPGHRCVSFKFTSESKRQLIENLQLQFERREITLLDEPVQTGELLAYEYDVTAKGTVTMNAPDGMHDDTVIGLALAAWEFRPRQTGFSTDVTEWRRVLSK